MMRFFVLLSISLLSLTFICGQEVSGTYKLNNNVIENSFKEIRFSESTIEIDGKAIPITTLETIKFKQKVEDASTKGFVELNSGAFIYFNSIEFEKEKLIIHQAHLGKLVLSILSVKLVSFINESDDEFDEVFYQNRFNLDQVDILRLKKDDQVVSLEGMVSKIADDQLSVVWKGKERKIDLEKVLMIKFSTAKKRLFVKGFMLQLTDGSRLFARKISSEGDQFSVESEDLSLSFPIALLSMVEIKDKLVLPLTEIIVDVEKKDGVLLENKGFELNRSYHKKELASSKREFHSGFGVHSDSQLTFTLPEGVTEIVGAVCFENSHSKLGECIVEIKVDSNSVWKKELNSKNNDLDFKLSIVSGKKLELIVLCGEDLDPGDSVIWGDVKLKIKD